RGGGGAPGPGSPRRPGGRAGRYRPAPPGSASGRGREPRRARSQAGDEVLERRQQRLQVGVAGKLAVEERIRPADALLVLLVGGQRQRLLELLEQRLRLQLGLDRDLLGDRDQEAAALDPPADDVLF